MALYPTYPASRLAYESDGTRVFSIDYAAPSVVQLNSTQVSDLNFYETEALDYTYRSDSLVFVFPERRYLYGICVHTGGGINTFSVSKLTTEDYTTDGSWTSVGSFYQAIDINPVPGYRNGVKSFSSPFLCYGIRLDALTATSGTSGISFVHLFGEPQYVNRLELVSPIVNSRVSSSYFEFLDVPKGSSATTSFRVRNASYVYTANSVTVSSSGSNTATPSVASQHLFSTDGLNFYSSVSIGNLKPRGYSQEVFMRRVTASDADSGLFSFKVDVSATSWS